MVGRYHSPTRHAYIYDTPEESLRDPYAKAVAVGRNVAPPPPVLDEEVESPDGAVVEETQVQTTTVIQPTPTPTPRPQQTPTPTPTPSPPPSSGGSSGSGGGGGYGY